jgi:hypothetical protein
MKQRILFVNNYDMLDIWNAWKDGRGSDTHLWGVNHMQADGLEVRIPPNRGPWPLNRLPTNLRWGDLDQQLRAWLRFDYDLLYAGAPGPVMGLGALRALGLFRRPIVAIMHHPPSGGRQPELCLSGFDRILCLSRRLQADLVSRFPRIGSRVDCIEWGPDIDFHRPMEGKQEFLLCEGKTLRDYDTLSLALAQVPIPTRIYCTAESAPVAPPPCVDLRVTRPGAYREAGEAINASYGRSLAVAIPLQDHGMLIGLTSLLTAMARGRAVICTRNPSLDIDIEAEGCGRWVRQGNVADWVEALQSMRGNPDEWRAMGERGRLLCKRRYNSRHFGQAVGDVLRECLAGR